MQTAIFLKNETLGKFQHCLFLTEAERKNEISLKSVSFMQPHDIMNLLIINMVKNILFCEVQIIV